MHNTPVLKIEVHEILTHQVFYELGYFIYTFVVNSIENEFAVAFCVNYTSLAQYGKMLGSN